MKREEDSELCGVCASAVPRPTTGNAASRHRTFCVSNVIKVAEESLSSSSSLSSVSSPCGIRITRRLFMERFRVYIWLGVVGFFGGYIVTVASFPNI